MDSTSCVTLFDPGGNHDKDLLIVTNTQLDPTDLSVSTLVFDPGGIVVKDLILDVSAFTMLNTEHLAKHLSYLLVIYRDELVFFKLYPRTLFDPGGSFSADHYLVNFTTFLFSINFVIRTEGEEKCLNLKPGGKIA